VFQYDLQAADINASRVTVAIYDGFMSPFLQQFLANAVGSKWQNLWGSYSLAQTVYMS
jgi:hypothetical protein